MANSYDEQLSELERSIKQEIQSYEDTITGLLAFAHELRWDDNARELRASSGFRFGRVMRTSSANAVAPNQEVTPDIVVQVDADYGVVGEAKVGYTPRPDQRSAIGQLRKYDDDLSGWLSPSHKVSLADLTFLVHETRAVAASDELKEAIDAGEVEFERSLAVIGFSRMSQQQEFLFLKRGFGRLSSTKDEKFRQGVPIKMEHLLFHYGSVELYDDKPPLPLLMRILWSGEFQALMSLEEYVDSEEEGYPVLRVSEQAVCEAVRDRMFPDWDSEQGQMALPRPSWIREALQGFMELNWARRNDDGTYSIELKNRRDPYGQFVRLEAKRRLDAIERRRTEKDRLPLLRDQLDEVEDLG